MYYRRAKAPGGTWFFTVNLVDRHTDTLIRHIDDLRAVVNKVKSRHPFAIVAMVVLPEHLHAVWRLPPDDSDYPLRWSLIKAGFSRLLDKTEFIAAGRQARRERGIWQRRYWEHQIRDVDDLARHVDYVHYNPVKHGWVSCAADWPHSTLHGYIERGMVAVDWGGGIYGDLGRCGER
jgi:putative transposase